MEREEQAEHEERAEGMEERAEGMEEDVDRLGERIEDAQADWERKEQDPAVPGAQPDHDDEEEGDGDDGVS